MLLKMLLARGRQANKMATVWLRHLTSAAAGGGGRIRLCDNEYATDEWTNVTPNIRDKLDRRLLHQRNHPLNHLSNKIKHFFYKTYLGRSGTPLFSVYDNFKPIVTVDQNFDRFDSVSHALYFFALTSI